MMSTEVEFWMVSVLGGSTVGYKGSLMRITRLYAGLLNLLRYLIPGMADVTGFIPALESIRSRVKLGVANRL